MAPAVDLSGISVGATPTLAAQQEVPQERWPRRYSRVALEDIDENKDRILPRYRSPGQGPNFGGVCDALSKALNRKSHEFDRVLKREWSRLRADSLYIGPAPPPPTYPPPIYMPPAPILTPIVEGSIPLFQPPPPPMILRREVKFCAACGKLLRKAAFSGTQWRSHRNRRRCNVCVKSASWLGPLPPLPDDG